MPPIESAARRFQRPVMIIPPTKDTYGDLVATKQVQGFLLPLLRDLQRAGPRYTGHADPEDVFETMRGSVPPEEVGQGIHVQPHVYDSCKKAVPAGVVLCFLVCLGFHAC